MHRGGGRQVGEVTCRTKEARLILQSGIYISYTNISESTAFLLQSRTYNVIRNIYSGLDPVLLFCKLVLAFKI